MRVMVIDDSRSSAAAIAAKVRELGGVEARISLDPEEAIRACADDQFDLLLIDYIMPKLDGIEVVAALRAREAYRHVPIIMVASTLDPTLKNRAFEAGTTDFLNKPFDWIELQARVRNLLALRSAQLELLDRADRLSAEVAEATANLVAREEEIIWRLARAVEYRDGTTGDHVSRVAEICRILAETIGLGEERARILYLAAPLHDIGKIGTPDAVLKKPGRLSADEMAIMRKHVEIGAAILGNASTEVVRVAGVVAETHHERWDGNGYPAGLVGEEIPIEGRLVSLADVFDALCSERPYKAAWPVEKAYAEILACSGSQFDPACVEAFKAAWPRIRPLVEACRAEAIPEPA